MARYSTIKLSDREFEAMYSTRAMMNVAEMCGGDLNLLPEFMKADGNKIEVMNRLCLVMAELINGAIAARNADILFGLANGEKKPFITADMLIDVITPGEVVEAQQNVYEVIGICSEFNLPEGIKIEETDADLAEIKAEQIKEKN